MYATEVYEDNVLSFKRCDKLCKWHQEFQPWVELYGQLTYFEIVNLHVEGKLTYPDTLNVLCDYESGEPMTGFCYQGTFDSRRNIFEGRHCDTGKTKLQDLVCYEDACALKFHSIFNQL